MRYQVRVDVNALSGERYVWIAGFMLSPDGCWVAGRRVNIRPAEIDDLLIALEDASEINALRRAS